MQMLPQKHLIKNITSSRDHMVQRHFALTSDNLSSIKNHIAACNSCKNSNLDNKNFDSKKCSFDYDTCIMETLIIKKKNQKM